MVRWNLPILVVLILVVLPVSGQDNGTGWLHAGGDAGRTAYSSAGQITPKNVWRLQQAWAYRSDDVEPPAGTRYTDGFRAAPILLPSEAGGSLALCESVGRLVALDPASGRPRWSYEPPTSADAGRAPDCLGVSYWRDPAAADDAACAHRLFAATGDGRLVAVDARDGRPCRAFGADGEVAAMAETGSAALFAAPPAVTGGVVVFGHDALHGLEARSGEVLWTFDAGTGSGSEAWHALAVDEARKLVFVPTSGGEPTAFGGASDKRLAGSVVALRVNSGEIAWHFQAVHDDVWSSDPAALLLADVPVNGRKVPALVTVTAQSLVFVLSRESGTPLFPVEERPVSADGDSGGGPPATQPFPVKPPPLARTELGPDDAWGMTFWDEARCRRLIANSLHGGPFVPPGGKDAIAYPAATGAGRGGIALDPAHNLLVATVAQLASHTRVVADADPPVLERRLLLGQTGLPCTPPPWSVLVGVDLAAGEIRWSVPLGTFEATATMGNLLNRVGGRMTGGPIVTAGGLIFTGAAADRRLRAYDVDTGRQHWSTRLPAAAYATPLTYEVEGSQYVVVAAGGRTADGDEAGAWLLAYALPGERGSDRQSADDESP